MQAIEKIALNTNWISMILVFLFGIIAALKVIDAQKLKEYFFALFNKGFIEDEVEENTSFFSSFYGLLFVFSSIVMALTLSLIIAEKNNAIKLNFSLFLIVLAFVFGYFTVKSFFEVLLTRLFVIQKLIRFYVVSKFSYSFCISFFLLILCVIYQYSSLNFTFFICAIIGLFLIRFVFHVNNNKNLIFSQLFYFILYLCAFEIAPLFILFKLML